MLHATDRLSENGITGTSKSWLPLIVTLALSACGGTGQDEGSPNSTAVQQTFHGRAVDGYLTRASVYLDTNNNGTRDAWEPFAFTDDDGYFGVNALTGTDYCATESSADQKQFCLRSTLFRSSAIIRVEGGYDVYTGEPFFGQMSKRLTNIASQSSVIDTSVVSPLTTLTTNIQTMHERSRLLSNLGLVESDLDIDYLNVMQTGMIDHELLNTALKVHKASSVLADRLTDHYHQIGEEFGTPNDATATIYQNVAQMLSTTDTSLETLLNDTSMLRTIIRNSERHLRSIYDQRDFDLPSEVSEEVIARASEVANTISHTVDALITAENSDATDHQRLKGLTRGLETLFLKAIHETALDQSIEQAFQFLTSPENATLRSVLIQSLSEDDADVSRLAGHHFTGDDFQTAEGVARISRIGPAAEKFTGIAGKQLRISDLDLGQAPHRLRDMELEIYFEGADAALKGSFKACGKFIEDAHIDGTLGEGNTRGELLRGYWSLMNPSADDSSYNVLLTIEFLGSTYSATMKSVGPSQVNSTEYKQIRFDHDGEYRIWHSENGLQETDVTPDSHKECEARLPSRVGL